MKWMQPPMLLRDLKQRDTGPSVLEELVGLIRIIETSNFWKGQFFQEFYWDETFSETDDRAFENQIAKTQDVLRSQRSPLFFFMNVPTTHIPYRSEEISREGQARAFQYLDEHFSKLLEILPKPCHFLLWSDHGECFGENQLWGHGFYHRKVIEVPMIHFIVK